MLWGPGKHLRYFTWLWWSKTTDSPNSSVHFIMYVWGVDVFLSMLVCLCAPVHVDVCACLWRTDVTVRWIPQSVSRWIFWDKVSHWKLSHWFHLASRPESSETALTQGLQTWNWHSKLFTWMLETWTRFFMLVQQALSWLSCVQPLNSLWKHQLWQINA